jgi:hypothetical protein
MIHVAAKASLVPASSSIRASHGSYVPISRRLQSTRTASRE